MKSSEQILKNYKKYINIVFNLNNIFIFFKFNFLKFIYTFWQFFFKNIVTPFWWNVVIFKKNFVKKWWYTINHKKLGLLYFFFSLITAIMGSYLATCIRLEMAYPGSPFFNGDSLKYLQVITAHAIIMIFFVVSPIFFGGFANYLLPYHIGSKDVAYPRLNNLGFWIQPCGFLLIAKMGSLRLSYWTAEVQTSYFSNMYNVNNFLNKFNFFDYLTDVTETVNNLNSLPINLKIKQACEEAGLDKKDPHYIRLKQKFIDELQFYKTTKYNNKVSIFENNFDELKKTNDFKLSSKLILWKNIYNSTTTFWSLTKNALGVKRQKRFLIKCSNAPQTVAGWTFITPFSSNTEYTGFGIQDLLILGVYYVGISTTISVVNLLTTRRVLSMPGLRNRRVLIPFITIANLLMLRALAIITPVLGSAMLMLLSDRHWKTSFFDYSYGGDPVFFQHLFWFFGHPEVYVLIIPAFGIINSVITSVNYRRVASKHHLIWAIYVMNYMGFLVWGHHMYLVGLDHRSRSLYSTITIMISLPATIKVVNWTYTLMNGLLKNNLILYGITSFILLFLVAGLTGMWLSHVSLNISMHDSLYVVAHFHLMLSGSVMLGIFVGFYFYYSSFLQTKYSKIFSLMHILYFSLGQWGTFLPLFWVAYSGLPRRLHDFPLMYLGWQSMATSGHFITMLGVFSFYTTLIESNFDKKLSILSHNLTPRFYNYSIILIFKTISLYLNKKLQNTLPKKKTRLSISKHIFI